MQSSKNIRSCVVLARRRKQSGLSLIEVMFSIVIFAMMGLMFAAVVPTAARTHRYANSYAIAAGIANRKIEQLTEAGWGKLNTADLISLGIIDNAAPTTDGAATIYTFTANNTATNANNADNLSSYFPSTVTGTIRVEDWLPSAVLEGGATVYVLKRVTVRLAWRDARGGPSSYTISTLITRMSLT